MVSYNTSTKEEIRKRKAKGERDQIKFIGLGYERWQVCKIQESKRKARHSISCMF